MGVKTSQNPPNIRSSASKIRNPKSSIHSRASRRLVFLGPPGSGKGTAASWIARRLCIPHVSTGEIFRHEISTGSKMGRVVDGFISKGRLVPDEIVMKIVGHWILCHGKRGFVFDGFPRTFCQARLFQNLLKRRSLVLDAVIYLKVSFSKVKDRVMGRRVCMTCGENFHVRYRPPRRKGICDVCSEKLVRRDDDNLNTLRKRWVVFKKRTVGLVEFYCKLGLLVEVDASGGPRDMCNKAWKVVPT